MTTPTATRYDRLTAYLRDADPLDVHVLVPVALIQQVVDDLADLHGRIEQVTLNLGAHFHAPQYVATLEQRAVDAALYLLAGEPDGADL